MQAKETQTEMNQLAQDIESTFQRLLKIDPLDVSSHRTLAIAEIFTKYVLYFCMNKIIVFICLNAERMKN